MSNEPRKGRHPESLGEWIDYDPTWLVAEAARCHPKRPELQEALAQCRRARWGSEAFVYFVDESQPNQPGSAWQFEENVMLLSTPEGDLVLDLLKGSRIGGVEFLDRVQ